MTSGLERHRPDRRGRRCRRAGRGLVGDADRGVARCVGATTTCGAAVGDARQQAQRPRRLGRPASIHSW